MDEKVMEQVAEDRDRGSKAHGESDEFHYHYSARKEKSHLSKGSREMLDLTGKIFLSGAIAMGGIFAGGFFLIAVLILGSFTVFLGGGTIFCLGTAVYLAVSGFQMFAVSFFTGLGICGLGLMMIAVTLLFLFATAYWVRKVIPGSVKRYQKFRTMFGSSEEAKE